MLTGNKHHKGFDTSILNISSWKIYKGAHTQLICHKNYLENLQIKRVLWEIDYIM